MTHPSRYVALLRGINVGGNAKIAMQDLRSSLEKSGLESVRTYIQSGNVIFESDEDNTTKLSGHIEDVIEQSFELTVPVVVFTQAEWAKIIHAAPSWWGKDPEWKHNLLILLKPYDMPATIAAIGVLKPDIERLEPGEGVLYQAMSRTLFGRTTTGKLASSPIYQRMTVRNYNTATKLLTLLNE